MALNEYFKERRILKIHIDINQRLVSFLAHAGTFCFTQLCFKLVWHLGFFSASLERIPCSDLCIPYMEWKK